MSNVNDPPNIPIISINNHDVVFEPGIITPGVINAGTRHWQILIAASKSLYHSLPSAHHRELLVKSIVQAVVAVNGRFLAKIHKSSNQWYRVGDITCAESTAHVFSSKEQPSVVAAEGTNEMEQVKSLWNAQRSILQTWDAVFSEMVASIVEPELERLSDLASLIERPTRPRTKQVPLKKHVDPYKQAHQPGTQVYDVVFGDDDESTTTNTCYPGNKLWRLLIQANKSVQVTLPKKQQNVIAKSIVHAVHMLKGRFLVRDLKSGLWFEDFDTNVEDATSHAFDDDHVSLPVENGNEMTQLRCLWDAQQTFFEKCDSLFQVRVVTSVEGELERLMNQADPSTKAAGISSPVCETQNAPPKSSNENLKRVKDGPLAGDVVLGRGSSRSHLYFGSMVWRLLIQVNMPFYQIMTREHKQIIVKSIVHTVRHSVPPGRFLQHDMKFDLWFEVQDEYALASTAAELDANEINEFGSADAIEATKRLWGNQLAFLSTIDMVFRDQVGYNGGQMLARLARYVRYEMQQATQPVASVDSRKVTNEASNNNKKKKVSPKKPEAPKEKKKKISPKKVVERVAEKPTKCTKTLVASKLAEDTQGQLSPHAHDVVLGTKVTSYPGNKVWRLLIQANKPVYPSLSKQQQQVIVKSIVYGVHYAAGRFLVSDKSTGPWFELPDDDHAEEMTGWTFGNEEPLFAENIDVVDQVKFLWNAQKSYLSERKPELRDLVAPHVEKDLERLEKRATHVEKSSSALLGKANETGHTNEGSKRNNATAIASKSTKRTKTLVDSSDSGDECSGMDSKGKEEKQGETSKREFDDIEKPRLYAEV